LGGELGWAADRCVQSSWVSLVFGVCTSVGNKGSAVCRVGPEPALLEEAGQSGRLEIEIARMKKDGWQVKSDG